MRRNFLRGLIICLVPILLASGFMGWAAYEESPAAQQKAAERAAKREEAVKELSAAVAALVPLQQEDVAVRARGEKLPDEKAEQLKQAVAREKKAREDAAPDGWKPQFRRGIDLAGGTSLTYQVKSGDLEEKEIKELADKLKMRIDENDLKNVVVRPVDRNKVEIILPTVGGAGGKEQANKEFVADVQRKVEQTGVLEFRIIANLNDDEGGVRAALEILNNPANQSELDDLAKKGLPPKPPVETFNVKAAGETEVPVSYEWVELGKEERESLGLSQRFAGKGKSGKTTDGKDYTSFMYDELAAMRGKPYVSRGGDNSYVLFSRAFAKPTATRDEAGKTVEYYILTRKSEADALRVVDDVKVSANYGNDPQKGPIIQFEFTAGGKRFYELTKRNKFVGFHRQMAIIMDGKLVSFPQLNEPLNGSGIISGNFDAKSANQLVQILKSGNLNAELDPTPVGVSEVPPTLGETNIRNGLIAVAASFIAVLLFMLVYYRFAGFVACVALFVNLLLTVGFMVVMNAAFTLPGLAGIVLMLGMAVDANVLIYERLREEREKGATLAAAIRNGYDRALPTIIDTHLTSIFTSIVLYAFGNAELKGFSVSLTVGLIISLFTSLFITRLMFDFWLHKKWLTQLKMLKLFARPAFNFMKIRNQMFALTAFLTVAGLALFLSRGERVLSIHFTGGTEYGGRLGEGKEKSLSEVQQLLSEERQKTQLAVKDVTRNTQAGKAFIYDVTYADGSTTQLLLTKPPRGATEADQLVNLKDRLSQLPDFAVAAGSGGKDQGALASGKLRAFTVSTTEKEKEIVQVAVDRLLRGDDKQPLLATVQAKPFAVTDSRVNVAFEKGDGTAFDGKSGEGVSPTYFRDFVVRALKTGNLPDEADDVTVTGVPSADPEAAAAEEKAQQFTTLSVDFGKMKSVEGLFLNPANAEQGKGFIGENLTKAVDAFKSRPVPTHLSSVGAGMSEKARDDAFKAIVFSWVVILVYLWFRFGSWQFGLAAVICLIHDLCFTLGCIAACHFVHDTMFGRLLGLSDFKIDMTAIAALLTLVGYSVNDTIVVFDRIREVRGKNPVLTAQMINDSVNQTLSRTILAALTVFLVVVVLYIWGGENIHLFAFVMVMGVIVGTYSSIYIASPLLLIFGEGKPKAGLPGSGGPAGDGEDRPAETAPVSAIAS